MKRSIGIIGLLVGFLTAAGGYYAYRLRGGDLASVSVLIAFAFLMVPYFALGFDHVVDALRSLGKQNRIRLTLMGLLLTGPGIIILMGQGEGVSVRNMAVLALYVSVPIMILATWGHVGPKPNLTDVVALAALWLPVELQYFETFWELPTTNPSYVLAKTLAMELALFCFVVVRRLDGVGYRFRLAGEDFVVGAIALAVFLLFGVPAALGTGFVEFDPQWAGAGQWMVTSLGIFFFIALPEEVLFRGLIFNMVQRHVKVGGPYTALVISAVIFGLAHLNNSPGDWRYVLLATIAGICYGWAYLRTGSLLAAAYPHALVDIMGRMMFPHGPS